ncbi:uncharacterized protein LTR77_010478 [Saxophila tyrrhenica]|uniref:EthD domain-containing protein n=1 Tax=Saxophila tyrrhenica TaxID=1690608 RepID=A0AAV9NZ68_9PEZI|nr:hypothetical protein LTR77_010478 [Saxophila tyrrhenica]
MSPPPYLLHVNSRPTQVSNDTWEEWYKVEHLPDLYNAKTCARATFYEEIGHPLAPNPDHPRKYLALYQTEIEELLNSDGYKNGVRRSSDMFEKAGANSAVNQDNGDFDARYYSLWQEYDPKGTGERLSPHILCVYMNPADVDDFEKWYREEHLGLLAKLPGYRRSLRYKIGSRTPLTKGETQPFLAIHEVDDVSAFGSKEAEEANATPWTVKHIKESNPFIARAFKRISEQGY